MTEPDVQLQISNSDDFSVIIDVNAVVESWLTRTVNSSLKRANDIRNDKSKAVFDFFDFCAKSAFSFSLIELNLTYLLKTIFETLAAREFHGFACFDGNRFAR